MGVGEHEVVSHTLMSDFENATYSQGSISESPSLLTALSLHLPGAVSPLYQPGMAMTYGSLIVILLSVGQ